LDNLTHTLAGLLLAEVAVQTRPLRADGDGTADRSFRSALYLASIFVSNAPDLDFVYAGITERPFGYLLHHRGHSHTAPVCLGIALFTIGAVAAVARYKRLAWSRSDWARLSALCSVGPIAHVAMDFSNNYGVHPFWPLYDGWLYGDAVFIIEPFFWVVGLPPLVFAARSRISRWVLSVLLGMAVISCWVVALTTGLLPWPMAACVTALGVAATVVARRAEPLARIAVGVAASWAVAALFFAASNAARRTVQHALTLRGVTVHDIVITPMPANPFCSTALAVETRGDDYVVERATIATMPGWFPSDLCPTVVDGSPTAPFSASVDRGNPSMIYRGEFRAPLRELKALARENCQAASLLRFTRVPYWVRTGPDEYIVGDLRFDRRPGLDFSDARVAARPSSCPKAIPPWLAPRRDLLE